MEPAPEKPPVDAAIPTVVAVRSCLVSAVMTTLSSAVTRLLIPALTSFHITLPASATPTDVLDEAANVPVKSVSVVLSSAVTATDFVVEDTVLSWLISAPFWTSA